MTFKILTIFPEMVEAVLSGSILGRARKSGAIRTEVIDIRPFSQNKHKNTDDTPFGGGAGMVMLAQPIADAMRYAMGENFHGKRIYLSPKGETFTQKKAESLAGEETLILLCGHYEGVDQRVLDRYIDEEISVGDYVLTGGELGALIVTDAVSRLIKGVLGCDESSVDESFSSGWLEYPQYTRPREFEGLTVPDVLLDGNQALIDRWRRDESIRITRERRPELLKSRDADKDDRSLMRKLAGSDFRLYAGDPVLAALLYELGGIRICNYEEAEAYVDAGLSSGKRVFLTRRPTEQEATAAEENRTETFAFSPLAFDPRLAGICGDEGIEQVLFFGLDRFCFACCAGRLLPVRKCRDARTAEYGKGRRALCCAGSTPLCRVRWFDGECAEFPLVSDTHTFARAAAGYLKDRRLPVEQWVLDGRDLILKQE